ncbi:MAG: 4-hydroxy-tetrahydrodipicolinate reductase [Alphaproteobacteria bacterium]
MKVGVVGIAGRMGQTLAQELNKISGVYLAAATENPNGVHIGQTIGEITGIKKLDIQVKDTPEHMFETCDVVIDFSTPKLIKTHAELAIKYKTNLVVGTTGLDEEDEKNLNRAAQKVTVVQAGNMSLGVNILQGLTKKIAAILDEAWDIEVIEMHHRHKVDAPSGTALMLGKAAAEGRGVSLEEKGVMERKGHTGARKDGDIGFATLRGGSVVGEHSVIFAGEDELIELKHTALSRVIFAKGAIRAAMWCDGHAPGRYDMQDVLGLE